MVGACSVVGRRRRRRHELARGCERGCCVAHPLDGRLQRILPTVEVLLEWDVRRGSLERRALLVHELLYDCAAPGVERERRVFAFRPLVGAPRHLWYQFVITCHEYK